MDEFLEDHDLTENTIEFTQGTGMTPVTGRSDFQSESDLGTCSDRTSFKDQKRCVTQ